MIGYYKMLRIVPCAVQWVMLMTLSLYFPTK